jgi:hypothetical protein
MLSSVLTSMEATLYLLVTAKEEGTECELNEGEELSPFCFLG